MPYFGCENWLEWCALASVVIPEPERVVYAFSSRNTPGQTVDCAVWRDGAEYFVVRERWGVPRLERTVEIIKLSDEAMLKELMRGCESEVLRAYGAVEVRSFLSSGAITWEACWAEALKIAKKCGIVISWEIKASSSCDDSDYQETIATYDDPGAAVAHVLAELQFRQDEDPNEGGCDGDRPADFDIKHTFRRFHLPAHLEVFAFGTKVPRERPERTKVGEWNEQVWQVSLPGRGLVSFEGEEADAASAALILALPAAKKYTDVRNSGLEFTCKFRNLRIRADHSLTWETADMDGEIACRVTAIGDDPQAMLADIAQILEAEVFDNESA